MGDGGSYFLGYSLGSISLLNYSDEITYPFFIVILLFSVPLIDMLYVIINRIRTGRSPFKADREHIHYRLIKSGYSQSESICLLLLITQFTSILAVCFFLQNKQSKINHPPYKWTLHLSRSDYHFAEQNELHALLSFLQNEMFL